jgi:hypothetical protein
MALSASQVNADGVVHKASGKRTGTRVAADFTITLGFIPTYVKVINLTDRVMSEWFAGMNKGDSLKTIADGTMTLETSDGLIVGVEDTDNVADTVVGGTFFVDVSVDGLETDDDQVVWCAEGQ